MYWLHTWLKLYSTTNPPNCSVIMSIINSIDLTQERIQGSLHSLSPPLWVNQGGFYAVVDYNVNKNEKSILWASLISILPFSHPGSIPVTSPFPILDPPLWLYFKGMSFIEINFINRTTKLYTFIIQRCEFHHIFNNCYIISMHPLEEAGDREGVERKRERSRDISPE